LPTETRLHIAPGVERHVDLLHIREKEASTGMGKLIIDVYPPPADGRHVINPKKVEIELVASARNAKARRWKIIVAYDGHWGLDPWANLVPERPVLQEWRMPRFMAGRGKRGYRAWPRKLGAWWRRKRAK